MLACGYTSVSSQRMHAKLSAGQCVRKCRQVSVLSLSREAERASSNGVSDGRA